MRVQIDIPQHLNIADKAIGAIEQMLEQSKVIAEPDGGLSWGIELDGYTFAMTVDRNGKVRATVSD